VKRLTALVAVATLTVTFHRKKPAHVLVLGRDLEEFSLATVRMFRDDAVAAGLRDPYMAGSPVIAITGGRDPKTKFRKVYQEIDDVPAFEPVTKFNATIDDISRAPRCGRPGRPPENSFPRRRTVD